MIIELQLKFKSDTGTPATTEYAQKSYLTEEYVEWLEDLALKQIKSKKNTCTLTHKHQDFMELYATSCCGIGPITNENYCPNCGSKIIRVR